MDLGLACCLATDNDLSVRPDLDAVGSARFTAENLVENGGPELRRAMRRIAGSADDARIEYSVRAKPADRCRQARAGRKFAYHHEPAVRLQSRIARDEAGLPLLAHAAEGLVETFAVRHQSRDERARGRIADGVDFLVGRDDVLTSDSLPATRIFPPDPKVGSRSPGAAWSVALAHNAAVTATSCGSFDSILRLH